MASRRLFMRNSAIPAAAAVGVLAASALTMGIPRAYAESYSQHIPSSKKPIYDSSEDDAVLAASAAAAASPSQPSTALTPDVLNPKTPSTPNTTPTSSSTSTSGSSINTAPGFFFSTRPNPADSTSTVASRPTPTDRLTGYVRTARISLHSYAASAETATNNLLTRFFHLERSFTSTVASLAPPRSANEPLVPGLVYVLVGTMAGSIVSRNRGFLLRTFTPLGFGLAAASAVLPVTLGNVGQLAWDIEKRYPVVADTHERVQERVERFWETGKAHTVMGVHMMEERMEGAVKGVEDWVRKGK